MTAVAGEAWRDSPTANEPGHLVAGLSHWRLRRLELFCVNPPLVRALAAVPALFIDPEMDWAGYSDPPFRCEDLLGWRFFLINGQAAMEALLAGRLMCLPLSDIENVKKRY